MSKLKWGLNLIQIQLLYFKYRGFMVETIVTKLCPYCKEEIKADAVKCKHCKEFLYKDSCEQIVERSPKSYVAALILCVLLEGLGIHRFYTGKIWTGILMLITLGGLGIWSFIDLIVIACCHFRDKQRKIIRP